MPAIHHPTDQTGLTLDELEAELDRIEAKRQEIDRQYLTECERDYANHLARIFPGVTVEPLPNGGTRTTYYAGPPDPDLMPDPCPICGGTGDFEDEEGFFTDCPCRIDEGYTP